MHARGWTTATVLALMVAGCAQEQRAPSPASPALHRRSAARPQPGPSAADYVARSGSIDLFIIGSSELALQRSANARVREFATMMIQAHKATSAQLSLEGRRLNLLPSATPLPAHQAMLNALQSTANFDSTYRQQMRAIHAEALALQSNYAAHGASPTLRPVAVRILPVIERHIRLLKYL